MHLSDRKDLLVQLGHYMLSNDEQWQQIQQRAFQYNNWFTPEFVQLAVKNIVDNFLTPEALQQLINQYALPDARAQPGKIGIVMAGNIPLVGFHDLLCVFLSGHIAVIKPSSKDEVLIKHLVQKLWEWNEATKQYIIISEMLKSCDAYIATGSNNSSRYFEQYFSRYPHIIRKNRTSVALLTGRETTEELEKLADDVHQFFGLGCRNVTKLYVPQGYDFEPLLTAFKKYQHFIDHHKYKNNYDYQLAIQMLNHRYYMTNGSIVLTESDSPFSPVSQLHYEYYTDKEALLQQLSADENIQCIIAEGKTSFGQAQYPQICDYADGVDTMQFLLSL